MVDVGEGGRRLSDRRNSESCSYEYSDDGISGATGFAWPRERWRLSVWNVLACPLATKLLLCCGAMLMRCGFRCLSFVAESNNPYTTPLPFSPPLASVAEPPMASVFPNSPWIEYWSEVASHAYFYNRLTGDTQVGSHFSILA